MEITTEVSTHRKILIAIHENWFNNNFFALREVANKADVSKTSVVRTLKVLKTIRMIIYSKKSYAGRHYRIAPTWPGTCDEIIQAFELAKILKM